MVKAIDMMAKSVRDILNGDKRVTRRPVRFSNDSFLFFPENAWIDSGWKGSGSDPVTGLLENEAYLKVPYRHINDLEGSEEDQSQRILCPYHVGERYFVREEWREEEKQIFYRATDDDLPGVSWKSAKKMGAAKARLWLHVWEVRVERLQDLTHDDILIDFCPSLMDRQKMLASFTGYTYQRDWCQKYWDALYYNTRYVWRNNPWVWVISFSADTRI